MMHKAKEIKIMYKAWFDKETKDKWISEREPYERWLERKLYKAQSKAEESPVSDDSEKILKSLDDYLERTPKEQLQKDAEFIQEKTPTVGHPAETQSLEITWIKYDFQNKESRPPKYDKYFVMRKDGKVHWETWNGSGWAYNENSIVWWAKIELPK